MYMEKNVVKQLLQDDKKIYEIIMAEGIRDTELVDAIKQKKIPLKTMGKKKDGYHAEWQSSGNCG